ncbi:hypothetical protein D8674_035979 [Pyrus ussuriensis x Pyrus communis]|uniref:Uncharacterized protein n=1 Tax=Pyrus ussuriensis x Pyrus communis TaxID=2448454 RepID=A0A5N5GF38_9ROSA|nr:hypothetical protein D8674_035979 [Pyrus ussuriensis x Pyrus communis]
MYQETTICFCRSCQNVEPELTKKETHRRLTRLCVWEELASIHSVANPCTWSSTGRKNHKRD